MTRFKSLLTVPFVVAALTASSPAAAEDSTAGNNTAPASASESKAPGSGPNPYRDCGIGAAIFGETAWAAVSSNVIWDLGTTALSSATASPQTCNGKQVKAAQFISDTYDKLVEETASGQGEYLTTALNIMECDGSRHASTTHQIREAMKRAVSNPNYVGQSAIDKASNLYSIIDGAVSTTCTS